MALDMNQLFRMCNAAILCLPPKESRPRSGLRTLNLKMVNLGIRQGKQLLRSHLQLNTPSGSTALKSSWMPSHGLHHQWPNKATSIRRELQ